MHSNRYESEFGTTVILNCSVCQKKLSHNEVVRAIGRGEICLESVKKEHLSKEIFLYPFTYAGSYDICLSCNRSLEMFIEKNKALFERRVLSEYELLRTKWIGNRVSNVARKINTVDNV